MDDTDTDVWYDLKRNRLHSMGMKDSRLLHELHSRSNGQVSSIPHLSPLFSPSLSGFSLKSSSFKIDFAHLFVMDEFEHDSERRRKERQKRVHLVITIIVKIITMITMMLRENISQIREIQMDKKDRLHHRMQNLNRIIRESDVICKNELRVNRHTFDVLCEMTRDIGGLHGTKNMELQEIVAMFLFTLAHHKKNRSIGNYFVRSGESVSRQFNLCLLAVLKLHRHLLKKPTPIPEDCEDGRWKIFKNCLGALDGTFISVHVPNNVRSRYRTRKGDLAMNVLGVCTPKMEFIYILPGWEGSAHDGRVLRDALSRPGGLKVPQGNYYLADAGYTNCKGFLTPYRGHRYHLKEWGDRQPESAEEYFNMKHSKARNVIERCFGLLKGRWAILRSPSFFPIRTQGRIVIACALLHNLIRKHMPTEQESEEEEEENDGVGIERGVEGQERDEPEYITHVVASDTWTSFRNTLAQSSFNHWRAEST